MNIIKTLEVFEDKNVTIEITIFPKGDNFFTKKYFRIRFLYQDETSIKYQKDTVIMGEMINDIVRCNFMLIDLANEFNDYINKKSTDINTDASN